MNTATMSSVRINGLSVAYRDLGAGPPVLLLHGWPTSSFLWRDVAPAIARENRVLALDLPGFGASDKPGDASYDFAFFENVLDGFVDALELDAVGIAGHDIGGPIAAHWTLARPGRVTKLALLNTLVYPEFSEAVMQFVEACSTPALRDRLTSPDGLEAAMRLGLADDSNLTDEMLAGVREPFTGELARLALAAAGIGLRPSGFEEIARGLPSLEIPLRVIYGEQDRILPDIADTVARLSRDVPHAEVTSLPHCGHFLQEEAPGEVGELLARFFAA